MRLVSVPKLRVGVVFCFNLKRKRSAERFVTFSRVPPVRLWFFVVRVNVRVPPVIQPLNFTFHGTL
jgi:hypothetical protein